MPTEAKVATVAQLTKDLSDGGPAIVADYRGLTVAELTAMRRSLREHGRSLPGGQEPPGAHRRS